LRQFPPSRIVCLTEETVETLYLLGEQDRIVGVSGYAVRPPQVRREKPRVSAFTSADIPKIRALEPDLVLTFSDLQAEIAGKQKAAKDRIVSPHDVIAAAPDVIVASWCGKKVVLDKIRQRSGWDAIPAVRNCRIVEIKSALILQPGPAALTDGLDAILAALGHGK